VFKNPVFFDNCEIVFLFPIRQIVVKQFYFVEKQAHFCGLKIPPIAANIFYVKLEKLCLKVRF
jgi:hypothetical protein